MVTFTMDWLGKHVFHFANALAMHQFPEGHFVAGSDANAPNKYDSKTKRGIGFKLATIGNVDFGKLT